MLVSVAVMGSVAPAGVPRGGEALPPTTFLLLSLQEFYPAGSYIVRQGATGNTFYIICGGTVHVTQRLPGSPGRGLAGEEAVIRSLGRGDYFGEQALLHDEHRTANVVAAPPGVECLALDRE